MLDKDFQLITKTGCGRGTRNYSATCPIKIKLRKTSKGCIQGMVYVSQFLRQFIGKNVNFFYNEKKNYFGIALAENGGVKCHTATGNYGVVMNRNVVEMMYKAYGIALYDDTLHLMMGNHGKDGEFIIMAENKLVMKVA